MQVIKYRWKYELHVTYSANTTAGFSIIKYTGTGNTNNTVGHGLGVAPEIILIKKTDAQVIGTVGNTHLGWTIILYI